MPSNCVVLEKTLESPLDCKEIKPVNPKGNQSWIFIGRADAEAETPMLWPPDMKGGLTGKDPNAGKNWRQEEKGTTEDKVVGWHHWLNGHESGQAWEDEGQGSQVCCSPLCHEELDTAERLNNNKGGTSSKEPANSGDMRPEFDPWVGKTPWRGHSNPLQCSCLENPMDRGAWWATVQRSKRVRHNWNDLAHTHTSFFFNKNLQWKGPHKIFKSFYLWTRFHLKSCDSLFLSFFFLSWTHTYVYVHACINTILENLTNVSELCWECGSKHGNEVLADSTK